jgi:outer membrane cobalamin receptor
VLYIDGVQVNQPEEGAALSEMAMVPAIDIQAIEVYRGAGTLPPEFAGPDAMCGAIVIWTKRGG